MVLWAQQYYWKLSPTIAQLIFQNVLFAPCTILGNHITLHQVKFLFLTGLLTSGKLISSSFPNGNDLYVFPWNRGISLQASNSKSSGQKPIRKKSFPPGVFLDSYIMIEEPILLDKLSRRTNLAIFQHFHCTYHPPYSGLAEHSNGIIKTQLSKPTTHCLWSTPAQNLAACPFKSKIYSYQKGSVFSLQNHHRLPYEPSQGSLALYFVTRRNSPVQKIYERPNLLKIHSTQCPPEEKKQSQL